MKITINFATPLGRAAPYLAGVSVLLAVLAGTGSVALFLSARGIRADMPSLEERLAHYRDRAAPSVAGLPPEDRLAALRARVQAMNGLTGASGLPLPTLLAHLEKQIPDGVWLVNLQLRSREGEAKLIAEADRAALLTEFMDRLEHSGYFSQVLLTRQAQRGEGEQRAIEFEIQLRERS